MEFLGDYPEGMTVWDGGWSGLAGGFAAGVGAEDFEAIGWECFEVFDGFFDAGLGDVSFEIEEEQVADGGLSEREGFDPGEVYFVAAEGFECFGEGAGFVGNLEENGGAV